MIRQPHVQFGAGWQDRLGESTAPDRRRSRPPRKDGPTAATTEPPNSSVILGVSCARPEEHHTHDPQVIDRRDGGVQNSDSRQNHKPGPRASGVSRSRLKELPKTANLPQKPASGGMPIRLNMQSASVAASRGRSSPGWTRTVLPNHPGWQPAGLRDPRPPMRRTCQEWPRNKRPGTRANH